MSHYEICVYNSSWYSTLLWSFKTQGSQLWDLDAWSTSGKLHPNNMSREDGWASHGSHYCKPWMNEIRPPSLRKSELLLISTIPETSLLKASPHCNHVTNPVTTLSKANQQPPPHYFTLHSLLGDPAEDTTGSGFPSQLWLLSPPSVLCVAAHVVTSLLLTTTQCQTLSARTGLPTGTWIPVAPSGNNN